jgi:hypothetical protein
MPDISVRLAINVFLVLGAIFALTKGGIAERAAAVVVIANVIIGQVGNWLAPDSDTIIRLVNDGLTAMVLLAITVRYSALWMGGVMLFFAAQFTLHSFYLVTARPATDYVHALINNIDWSAIAWCLIIGTAVAWRQRVRAKAVESAP